MIRIWADFHTQDPSGRVPLNTAGSLRDLARYRNLLQPGTRVTLYESTFEVEGSLELEDGIWRAVVDWTTYRPTSSINLAREMRGWGFPPCLGYSAAHFIVDLVRRTASGLRTSPDELEEARADAGVHRLEANALTQRICEFDDGDIVGVAGLSLREYPHRIRVGNRDLFAWCAWDAIAMTLFLQDQITVETHCPDTGREIRLVATPRAAISQEPGTVVLRQVNSWQEEHPCESYRDVQEVFCRRQFLFVDADALVRWSKTVDDVEAEAMSPSHAIHLARLAWREIVDYVLSEG